MNQCLQVLDEQTTVSQAGDAGPRRPKNMKAIQKAELMFGIKHNDKYTKLINKTTINTTSTTLKRDNQCLLSFTKFTRRQQNLKNDRFEIIKADAKADLILDYQDSNIARF